MNYSLSKRSIRKIMTAVGSGVVGGVTGGLIGRMVFGSKIQDEAKELTLQAQQVEVGKEQLQAEAAALQQPFVMELANKMAASKKAAPAADIAPPSVAAPAPGASSQSLDDKVGDQSIKLSQESVTNTPAAVSSQSTLVGGVQPRGSHTGAAVAAKEQLAGVAATR
jgi:hypothetical protein